MIGGTTPARTIEDNGHGIHHGYYFEFYRDAGDVALTLGAGGSYAVRWHLGPAGNMVAGKGWAIGSAARIVCYRAGAFHPGSNGYLSLYGWSVDPLVEYYVVDSYGPFVPPGNDAVRLGTVISDGGTYALYRTQRINQPSIKGVATFAQYWSVRTSPRKAGDTRVISFANHVDAWRRHGMTLGPLGYQILATEGYASSGRAAVTVWERSCRGAAAQPPSSR